MTIRLRGDTISATVVAPDGKWKGMGVLMHGLGSDQSGYVQRAAALSKEGWGCIAFDFRGHGESSGDLATLTPDDHVYDCLAAWEALKGFAGADGSHLDTMLLGASYGGAIAVLASRVLKPKRLVLRAPALYEDRHIHTLNSRVREDEREEILAFRNSAHTPEESLMLAIAADYAGSVLLISSEHDEVIPAAVTDSYSATFSMGLCGFFQQVVMQGASHSLDTPEQKAEFMDYILRFIRT